MNVRITPAPPEPLVLPLSGPLLLGRQTADEEKGQHYPFTPPAAPVPPDAPPKVVVAWEGLMEMSQKQTWLIPQDGGLVRVLNKGRAHALVLADGPSATLATLPPQTGWGDFVPPFTVTLPHCTARVEATDAPAGGPAVSFVRGPASRVSRLPAVADADLKKVEEWLRDVGGLTHRALTGDNFLQLAAEALAEVADLDSGRVFVRAADGTWDTRPAAAYTSPGSPPPGEVSMTVLHGLRPQEVWHTPRGGGGGSQTGRSILAAPLLDGQNRVIGALYAEQSRAGGRQPPEAQKLLLTLLAGGVSFGLVRQAREEEAARAREESAKRRKMLDEFFTPDLAGMLLADDSLLEPKKAVVTALFCDIRGYSAITGRLDVGRTGRWLGEVLTTLSGCVLAEGGVVVDFQGDEIFALWGAPAEQPDQTERAVRAGLAMVAAVGDLNRRWADELGGPMGIGVGIDRGEALVGRIGSEQKFKYGAIGDVVNTASRVQGLTKYLKRPLLVTAAARDHAGAAVRTRRVVTAKLVNIERPVEVCEAAADGYGVESFFLAYERALDAAEADDPADACQRASGLLAQSRSDGPLLLLLSRATAALVNGQPFAPVWTPAGK